MIQLPPDFKEFLKLLNENKVEYLMVGGFAVGYHGYPRATGDLDIWIAAHRDNARKIVCVLEQFGFADQNLNEQLFLTPDNIVRMGHPPIRIELLSSATGVDFQTCYQRAVDAEIDNIAVKVISKDDLRANKRAAGRTKDLNDLENLP